MVKIRNSLIFKLVLIIVVLQSLIWVGVAVFIKVHQTNLLNELNKQQKEFVVKFIEEQKKKTKEKLIQNLYKLIEYSKATLSYSLYNYEEESAKKIISDVLLENDIIKGVEIIDTVTKSVFLSAYKKGNKKIIDKAPLPKEFKKYQFIKKELVYNMQPIGYIKIYYDITPVLKHLNELQQKELQMVNLKFSQIYASTEEKEKKLIFYFMLAALLTIVIVVATLLKFINEPLGKIQKGLANFFEFLSNPRIEVQKIDINTKDEFGEMAKFINEGIQVSAKLHRELAELMDVIDKNVMICEFDEKGKPIDVTEAFVEKCGYPKEELLSRQRVICNIDLEKVIPYIEKHGIWQKEVKCVSKDNKTYWMHSKIAKKCTFDNGECRYINILYDITDKKELEVLKNNLEDLVKEKTIEIRALLNATKESIRYASLIQDSILPSLSVFDEAFSDYFIIWEPKDVLGGDIYFIDEIRDGEYLLMVLDCTGHGVHGALMTMLVKAIQIQIINDLSHSDKEISPSEILSKFNTSIKNILKQYEKKFTSNAGFDGAIVYYDKNRQIIRFSSANVPLFIVDNGEIKEIRGDKRSVGDAFTPMVYRYKEYDINVGSEMKFYITTDGFIDQIGGEKEFPFGKRRFKELIEKYHELDFSLQKELFLQELKKYQQNHVQTDDITVVGFKP
ncbi:MAG: SpoIIE family protein phosphatase [Epsilonproteobacteria bacterium]|nr:SpoIIE family protein phosphatase [Campylobacterota bacterium]